MIKKKIFICGATGFLGEHLKKHLAERYNTILHGFKKKSVVNTNFIKFNEVSKIFDKFKPDIIINLICFSDVEKCQKQLNKALDLNTLITKNISTWILKSKKKTKFIQISTDHVYNENIVSSEQNINLVNNYAITKYLGELEALKAKGIVIRTNFFAIPDKIKRGLIYWLIDSCLKKKKIQLVKDIYFNPVHVNTLCEIIEKFFSKNYSGIVNVGSRDYMSKEKFLIRAAKHLNFKLENFESIYYRDLKNHSCVRPKYMMMNTDKLSKILKIKIPKLEDEIKKL